MTQRASNCFPADRRCEYPTGRSDRRPRRYGRRHRARRGGRCGVQRPPWCSGGRRRRSARRQHDRRRHGAKLRHQPSTPLRPGVRSVHVRKWPARASAAQRRRCISDARRSDAIATGLQYAASARLVTLAPWHADHARVVDRSGRLGDWPCRLQYLAENCPRPMCDSPNNGRSFLKAAQPGIRATRDGITQRASPTCGGS